MKKVNEDDAGWPKSITISCDVCGVSQKDEEIIAAGGLLKMGWHMKGDEHRCPKHLVKVEA